MWHALCSCRVLKEGFVLGSRASGARVRNAAVAIWWDLATSPHFAAWSGIREVRVQQPSCYLTG